MLQSSGQGFEKPERQGKPGIGNGAGTLKVAHGEKVTDVCQIMSCQPRLSYGIPIDDTGVKRDVFVNDTGVKPISRPRCAVGNGGGINPAAIQIAGSAP